MRKSFWDLIKDWVLLFSLLIVSLGVMLTLNQPLLQSMRAASLESTAWLESQFSWVGGFLTALEENSTLRRENIMLSSELARLREAESQNERLQRMLGMRDTTSYPLQPARIVSKDITKQHNMLIINAGRADSVKTDMAVVDERGIIGKVVLTSEHYAKVMPLINTDFTVPGKIQSLQTQGLVSWSREHPNRLLMEHVPKTEPVLQGQLVVTSGYSGSFPAGYPIGVVDSISASTGRNELDIYLDPVAPVRSAEYVFVVLHRPDEDLQRLQEQTVVSRSTD